MFLLFAHNLIIGFEGTTPEDPCVQKMIKYATKKIIGIILFRRNIQNAEQLKTLTSAFKKACPNIEISVDEEGYTAPFNGVSRLNEVVKPAPSAYDIANKYTATEAYQLYYDYALQLKALGVTMVFGPCVDLYDKDSPIIAKYHRAYSNRSEIVILYATQFIKAFKAAGIKTVVKHYPGHGFAKKDTHAETTNVTSTFKPEESVPFKVLSYYTPYVMMAHIIDDNVDPDTEASLSSKHYENARQMRYRYLITDDLHMASVQLRHQPIVDTMRNALKMGAIVIASNMPKASPTFKFDPDFDLPDKL